MSNVLIGIIGVILFIGLAIAGALFLGPRFTDSKSTSTAAATIQATSQIAYAFSYSNAELAVRATAGTNPATLAPAYLRSVPTNPAGPDALIVVSATGSATTGDGAMVVAKLSTAAASKTCGAIVRQTTNGQDTVGVDGYGVSSTAAEIPRGPAGCFKVGTTAIGDLGADQFYAFTRI